MRGKRAKQLRKQAIQMCQINGTPNAVDRTYRILKTIYKKIKGQR